MECAMNGELRLLSCCRDSAVIYPGRPSVVASLPVLPMPCAAFSSRANWDVGANGYTGPPFSGAATTPVGRAGGGYERPQLSSQGGPSEFPLAVAALDWVLASRYH